MPPSAWLRMDVSTNVEVMVVITALLCSRHVGVACRNLGPLSKKAN